MSITDVQMDMTNEEVHRRAGIDRELSSIADQRVLRWFGHVERINEYCMAIRVLIAEVSGPRLGTINTLGAHLG